MPFLGLGSAPGSPADNSVTSQKIADGTIQAVDIQDASVTAAKLSSSAITDKLGYTPVSPTQLNDLIDGAPAALNTLNELAAALGDDSNFATTVTNQISTKTTLGKAIAMTIVFGG